MKRAYLAVALAVFLALLMLMAPTETAAGIGLEALRRALKFLFLKH
jgi:hypothetical protein